MKSTFPKLWAIAAMLAAAFSACWRTIDTACVLVAATYRRAKDVVATARDCMLALFKTETSARMPAVRLVQAKAFVQRLTRRDRPTITNTWRYCPSI